MKGERELLGLGKTARNVVQKPKGPIVIREKRGKERELGYR